MKRLLNIVSNFKNDLLFVLIGSVVVLYLAGRYDIFEEFVEFSRAYEEFEIDEIITLAVFLAFALTIILIRRHRISVKTNHELASKTSELEHALAEIKKLQGILPICSVCKGIRDEKGDWHSLEAYMDSHSEAEFTHSVCPECMKTRYNDLYDEDELQKL